MDTENSRISDKKETHESESSNQKINYINVKSDLNWDEYFILQAMIASFKSKDPTTRVGAVFVDQNKHQITMGYNGFVAGLDESELPWGKDPSVTLEHQKYGYVVHAEANAILHSPRSLENSIAYVTLFPCHECAKLLASVKVKEIVFLSDKHKDTESNRIAKKIFKLANIEYRQLNVRPDLLISLRDHLESLTQSY